MFYSFSTKDNLIQLANMVVGAIARSYNDNRKDSKRWLIMLENKIEGLFEHWRPCTLV